MMSDKQRRPEAIQAQETETGSEYIPSAIGDSYTIVRGDTLSGIAQRAYGAARYWRHIMQVNPDSVGMGGNQIVVGDELSMPPVGFSVLDLTVTAQAVEPEEVRTPYGNFLVLPEGYEGEMEPREGWTIVHAEKFELVKKARIEQAEEDAQAAVKSAEALLSYSTLDWVVTDENAIDTMTLIAALPVPQRQAVLQQLGSDMTERLLDNLPDSIHQTVDYAKLLVGFGIEYVRNRIQRLEAQFLNGQGGDILQGVSDEHVDVLIAALPDGKGLREWQEAMLYSIFQMVPDSNLSRLEMLFEKRFAMDLKTYVSGPDENEYGVDWDAPQIRRMWDVLMYLPETDVEGNKFIDTMERYGDGRESGSGWYWNKHDGTQQIAMGFETEKLNNLVPATTEEDVLEGDVYFDQVLRHEVGHAVDDRKNIMDNHGKDSVCGAWKEHTSTKVADIWLNASAGPLGSLTGKERAAVRSVLIECMDSETWLDFQAKVAELAFWKERNEDGSAAAASDDVTEQLNNAILNPWDFNIVELPVAGRFYQRGYPGDWCSFKVSAKSNRVSAYQWRAPGEWFAEVYAAYYDPRQPRGALLSPALLAWFNKRVKPPKGPAVGDGPQ